MLPASIAAAEQRVIQSRRELYGALARLGGRLARPPSLVAAAAAGALAGFAIARRGGLGALARTLGAALLRHGMPLYVRYRTAQAEARGEDAAYETFAPNGHPVARPGGLRRRSTAR
jgi:hypothetical protein